MAKTQKSAPKKGATRKRAAARKKPAAPRHGWMRRIFGGLFYWGAVAGVWGVVILGGVLAFYAYDLPNVDQAFVETRKPSITVIAANGRELATAGDVYYDIACEIEEVRS